MKETKKIFSINVLKADDLKICCIKVLKKILSHLPEIMPIWGV